MSERAPAEEGMKKSEYIHLAVELSERPKRFPFFGMSHTAYTEIKATYDPEFDRSTPIDTLIEKVRAQGTKVVMGKYPQSGMVYVVPFDSDNVEEDGIFPRQLMPHIDMDPQFRKLIEANRKPFRKNS